MRVGAGVRADAEQYALGGLAALGARLPIPVAQQMLEIVVPLLPRQPNTYIVVDDELVAALVGVSRCTDRQLAARAAAALVDAIGHGLASATDRVVSLDRDLPGLLPALRERAQAGDEDAVRVLASWGEWHSFMTRPTQRLLEALFKHPVGQPRADFPIVSGVRTRPWCLISGLSLDPWPNGRW